MKWFFIKFKYRLSLFSILISRKIRVLKIGSHNGHQILNYPEKDWILIPFPMQKGIPFNADNLATVNKHDFIYQEKFINARNKAESRWGATKDEKVRDISWRLHTMLWAVSISLNRDNEKAGIFIECGTGKGYMAAGIFDYYNWDSYKPVFYLIDTFLSTMPDMDGVQRDGGTKLFAYAESESEVEKYFSKYKNVCLLKGSIPEILTELPDYFIDFLHIDLNNEGAEEKALDKLKTRLRKGSLILFDDYGGPGGEKQALIHQYFANEMNRELLILPTGQALLII